MFNDATGTHWFLSYHRLLDVIHMVTLTHFLEGNPLPPHRLLFSYRIQCWLQKHCCNLPTTVVKGVVYRTTSCSFMVQWVVGTMSRSSHSPQWCTKGHGMYCHVCGMMHIKEHLLPMSVAEDIWVVMYHMSEAN